MRTVLSVLALAASCEAFTPLAATRHAAITRRSKMSPVVRFNAPETEPADGTVRNSLWTICFREGEALGRAGVGGGASARADEEAGATPADAGSMRVTGPRRGRTSRPQRPRARSSRGGSADGRRAGGRGGGLAARTAAADVAGRRPLVMVDVTRATLVARAHVHTLPHTHPHPPSPPQHSRHHMADARFNPRPTRDRSP